MVRIKRLIPFPGRVLVELGQEVYPHTLVAETVLQPVEPIHLSVTEIFNVSPHMIQDLLRVNLGDMVEAGQVLAVGGFEGQMYELKAPGAGRIEQISHLLGTISLRLEGNPDDRERLVDVAKELGIPALIAAQRIRVRIGDKVRIGHVLATDPDEEIAAFAPIQGEVIAINGAVITIERPFIRTQTLAFVSGRVVEVIPELGAIIESTMVPLQGMFGLGGENYGELRLLVSAPDQIGEAACITAADSGRIIVAGALATRELLYACKQHGVVGVIAGGAHNMDLVQILGAEITPGMDAAQTLGLTLLLSEGMGRIAIEQRFFEALQQTEGQVVALNGLTQIRAGVIRPCVYLPGTAASNASEIPAEIAVGSTVRIIREPWFGILGTVRELGGLETLPSGIATLIYIVETENGDLLRVARSNVETMRR